MDAIATKFPLVEQGKLKFIPNYVICRCTCRKLSNLIQSRLSSAFTVSIKEFHCYDAHFPAETKTFISPTGLVTIHEFRWFKMILGHVAAL